MRHLVFNTVEEALEYFEKRDETLSIKYIEPERLYIDINMQTIDGKKVTRFLCFQAIHIATGLPILSLMKKVRHKKRFTREKLVRLYNSLISYYGPYLARLTVLTAEEDNLLEGFIYGAKIIKSSLSNHKCSNFIKALLGSKIPLVFKLVDFSFYPPVLRISLQNQENNRVINIVYNEVVAAASISTKKRVKSINKYGALRCVPVLEEELVSGRFFRKEV